MARKTKKPVKKLRKAKKLEAAKPLLKALSHLTAGG